MSDLGVPDSGSGSSRADGHPAQAWPLLGSAGLVSVDGHAICAACGREVEPVGLRDWRHAPPGRDATARPRWLEPVALTDIDTIGTYEAFARRRPWAVRAEIDPGGPVSEADWREAWDRLRRYRATLEDSIRAERVAPGSNPYLDLVRLLAGANKGDVPDRLEWGSPPGVLRALSPGERRRELVDAFAWAIPNEPALDALARRGPIVEAGAGSGYWAVLLRARGVDVVAFDLAPPGSGHGNPFHARRARPWAPVEIGLSVDVARRHPERTLFLCWPPNDDDAASHDAIRAYRGGVVAYVGEGRDGGGGTLRLHRELDRNWTVVETVTLPRWPRLRDRLVIYERNATRRPITERDRCDVCGRYRATGAIGRCDRCFERRPPALAIRAGGHRLEYPAEAVERMPAGLRRALERSPNRIR